MIVKSIKKLTLSITLAAILSITMTNITPLYHINMYAEAASISLNITNTTLYVGETLQLKLTGTTKTVNWSVDKSEIAKVSSSGIVTGLKKGTVKVTALVGNSKYTSTIAVLQKELTASEVYEKASKATVEILTYLSGEKYSLGSGFFTETGVVITNYHVVEGAERIQIKTYNGVTYEVEQILGYDENIDIAILKINSTNNKVLTINQEGVTVGESIYILGSPLGLTGTFANGMVSSASRISEKVDYIQVTAPMSSGNSGGPLLNRFGEVMGINTWQFTDGQNLNFSINIKELDKVKTNMSLTMSEFYQLTKDNNALTNELSLNLYGYQIITSLDQTNMLKFYEGILNGYYLLDYKITPEGNYVAVIMFSVEQ